MIRQEYHDLCMKFLMNELDKKEQEELSNWLSLSKENQDFFDKLEYIWGKSASLKTNIDVEEQWGQFENMINSENKQNITVFSSNI